MLHDAPNTVAEKLALHLEVTYGLQLDPARHRALLFELQAFGKEFYGAELANLVGKLPAPWFPPVVGVNYFPEDSQLRVAEPVQPEDLQGLDQAQAPTQDPGHAQDAAPIGNAWRRPVGWPSDWGTDLPPGSRLDFPQGAEPNAKDENAEG